MKSLAVAFSLMSVLFSIYITYETNRLINEAFELFLEQQNSGAFGGASMDLPFLIWVVPVVFALLPMLLNRLGNLEGERFGNKRISWAIFAFSLLPMLFGVAKLVGIYHSLHG